MIKNFTGKKINFIKEKKIWENVDSIFRVLILAFKNCNIFWFENLSASFKTMKFKTIFVLKFFFFNSFYFN